MKPFLPEFKLPSALGILGINLDIGNLYVNSGAVPILLLLLFLVILIVTYKTRTSFGFFLRNRFPISFISNDISTYKTAAKILFIDDQDVQITKTLEDDNWQVSKLRDGRVDDQKIKDANIIFVDWRGVGRRINAEEEGISLVDNLKRKYKHNKYIILYSSQEFVRPANIIADGWIKKGSGHDQYLQAIQRASFALFG